MEQEMKKVKEDNIAKNFSKRNEHRRKKNKNSSLVPILCFILGIILGIIGTMIFMGKDAKPEVSDNVKENLTNEQSVAQKSSLEELMEEDSYAIETPYGNLYYPSRWQAYVRVEQAEGDVYTVKFYSALEGKEECSLFDVAFGGETGTLIGILNDKPVYVNSASVELPADWTEDEKNLYYTMMEDINYLLGRLEQEEGFVPAS